MANGRQSVETSHPPQRHSRPGSEAGINSGGDLSKALYSLPFLMFP